MKYDRTPLGIWTRAMHQHRLQQRLLKTKTFSFVYSNECRSKTLGLFSTRCFLGRYKWCYITYWFIEVITVCPHSTETFLHWTCQTIKQIERVPWSPVLLNVFAATKKSLNCYKTFLNVPLRAVVVVAQLVEESLPIPEVHGSNPLIGKH